MFGAAGSGSAARGAVLDPAPLRGGVDDVAPVGLALAAGLDDDGGVLTLLIDCGAGRSARRFFVSGSSMERPSSSTCAASAARSSSSSCAGSVVTCTNPRTGTIPPSTRGAPIPSSSGRSPKAVRRTPSRLRSTNGSSSVPAICWEPSAVYTAIGVVPFTPKTARFPSWKPNSSAVSLSALSSSAASTSRSRKSSGAGCSPSTVHAASITCLRRPGTRTTHALSRSTSVAGPCLVQVPIPSSVVSTASLPSLIVRGRPRRSRAAACPRRPRRPRCPPRSSRCPRCSRRRGSGPPPRPLRPPRR